MIRSIIIQGFAEVEFSALTPWIMTFSNPWLLARFAIEFLNSKNACLHTRPMAEAMTTPPWNPFIGLGLFLDARLTDQLWYYHYGWGEGFQGALSLSPSLQGGVVILMNAELGVPQWDSLVGEVGRLIAAEMGWPRSPIPDLS